MKRYLLFFFIFTLSQFVFAQNDSESTLVDISKAKAFAQQQNVPILMIFAGSDWCKPCIQFKRGILSSESFKSYSKDHLVVLYLDFPLKKANKLPEEQTRQNEQLADKYNPSGAFPNILLLSADEELIGYLSFTNQTPEEFIESCEKLIN